MIGGVAPGLAVDERGTVDWVKAPIVMDDNGTAVGFVDKRETSETEEVGRVKELAPESVRILVAEDKEDWDEEVAEDIVENEMDGEEVEELTVVLLNTTDEAKLEYEYVNLLGGL